MKIKYNKINSLKPEEAGYLAGLIDGEGTVTLSRTNANKNRSLLVEIDNTDLYMLKWVKKTIGAGDIRVKMSKNENHCIAYIYRVRNRQALNILKQILPYLKTYKLIRSKLVIKEYVKVTPRNGKYSLIINKKRAIFLKKFFEILPRTKLIKEIA
ncbi:MAG: LAGLIDADG family homing endonuclease [Candidatus Nealsonbacteria bacterium]